MNRRDSIRYGASLALGALLPEAARACRLFPADSIDRYVAYHNGVEVGTQSIEFRRDAGGLVVTTEMDFEYRDDTGNAVTFSHRAREIWRQGWLNAFTATSLYASREVRIEAHSLELGILFVKSSDSKAPLQVTGYVVPSSLWHRDSRLVNRFIDLVDGRVKLVKVYYAGRDLLPHDGNTLVAAHYRVRGEIDRDAWYSEDCQLVRAEVPVRNAAPVIFDLDHDKI